LLIVFNGTGTGCSATQALPCRLFGRYDPIDIVAGRKIVEYAFEILLPLDGRAPLIIG